MHRIERKMVEKIKLAQGAGGQLMDKLIKEKILKYFEKASSSAEIPLSMLDDSAVVDNIVFSTDSHTVQPCLLYTSPSPRDATLSRMPSSA